MADLNGWKFSGLLAWLVWLFVHILFLIGFRNRLVVMIQWGYSYITHDRGARLITGDWSRSMTEAAREEKPPVLAGNPGEATK